MLLMAADVVDIITSERIHINLNCKPNNYTPQATCTCPTVEDNLLATRMQHFLV
jgi:hypothetical protein